MNTAIQNGLAISVPVLLVTGAELFGGGWNRWLSWLSAVVTAGGLLFLLAQIAVGTVLPVTQLLMMPVYLVLFFAFLRTGSGATGFVESIASAAKETLWCGTDWVPIMAGVPVLLAVIVGVIRLS
jgi:hypothetical protein